MTDSFDTIFPQLIWEGIYYHLRPIDKANFIRSNDDNIIRRMILQRSNMSQESLNFWIDVKPHFIRRPIAEFNKDRFMRNLFDDYIWIYHTMPYKLGRDPYAVHRYQGLIIYVTDLENIYKIDQKAVAKYSKYRRKYKRNPNDFLRRLNTMNELQFVPISGKLRTIPGQQLIFRGSYGYQHMIWQEGHIWYGYARSNKEPDYKDAIGLNGELQYQSSSAYYPMRLAFFVYNDRLGGNEINASSEIAPSIVGGNRDSFIKNKKNIMINGKIHIEFPMLNLFLNNRMCIYVDVYQIKLPSSSLFELKTTSI